MFTVRNQNISEIYAFNTQLRFKCRRFHDSCVIQEEYMEKDFYSNTFFADNERYADIINAFGCNGELFVKGKDLQELEEYIEEKRRNQ